LGVVVEEIVGFDLDESVSLGIASLPELPTPPTPTPTPPPPNPPS